MKKILTILSLVILTSIAPSSVFAHEAAEDHTHSVESEAIEERLKEEGLDQAPGEVVVPEREMLGEPPSSGYVDDDGNALSQEEYDAVQEDNDGIFKKNPAFLLLLSLPVIGAGALIAGIVIFVKSQSKK